MSFLNNLNWLVLAPVLTAITNRKFNQTAIQQANTLGVKLIARVELIELLEKIKLKQSDLDDEIFKFYMNSSKFSPIH